MLLETLFWIFIAFLGCIGFVQTVTWLGLRASPKGNMIYRIFPVGGEGKNTGKQMALLYACMQWESNPTHQQYILYDAGLDEQGVKDCTELARGVGIPFVRSAEELQEILR